MTTNAEMLRVLEINLRNAEATLGKDSTQYQDIMEVIEFYMSGLDAGQGQCRSKKSESAKDQELNSEKSPFANLVFRSKT
ncbi:uncharacterized protein PV09_07354 [Verruconis gallopava]|uniref:Uncharacterized protein n=1 Tax=Verruconis gallopava TaxID=253628 RepID=A0A0D2A3C2_9PEZI|nr:uncharacterized protein PV09_07354 [Verruconis gallopava]KIW01318.1 hypothetical protein PV09_07354 [Verruconis gallopava]